MEPLSQPLATYEDLLAHPEKVRAEVLSGALHVQPSPLPKHNYIVAGCMRAIGGPFDEKPLPSDPGGWWLLTDIDTRFGANDIVRPDVVGWRRERLSDPWDERPIDVRPDWVCEILSPSNAGHDRVKKADLYAKHDVPHYWIIDPVERVLEAFTNHEGGWLRQGAWTAESSASIAPFDAIELALSRLFPPEPE